MSWSSRPADCLMKHIHVVPITLCHTLQAGQNIIDYQLVCNAKKGHPILRTAIMVGRRDQLRGNNMAAEKSLGQTSGEALVTATRQHLTRPGCDVEQPEALHQLLRQEDHC